mmetsp:Transcript_3301/g.6921  ORF Transcript_3301/g.6921 Transcript_3301/m.6921 type:complete len:206 (+) Transcript_3301:519-1136(+)
MTRFLPPSSRHFRLCPCRQGCDGYHRLHHLFLLLPSKKKKKKKMKTKQTLPHPTPPTTTSPFRSHRSDSTSHPTTTPSPRKDSSTPPAEEESSPPPSPSIDRPCETFLDPVRRFRRRGRLIEKRRFEMPRIWMAVWLACREWKEKRMMRMKMIKMIAGCDCCFDHPHFHFHCCCDGCCCVGSSHGPYCHSFVSCRRIRCGRPRYR